MEGVGWLVGAMEEEEVVSFFAMECHKEQWN